MDFLFYILGTVLVDGVRKSTRRRKNPYVESEYVPAGKLDRLDNSDDDAGEWVCLIIQYVR